MNKKIKIIFLFSSLFIILCHSQNSKATLFFKNGNELNGYAKVKNNGKVKFWKNDKDEMVKYNFQVLEKVKVYFDDKPHIFVQIEVKDKKRPKVVEQVTIGEVSLFRNIKSMYNPGIVGTGFDGPGNYGISYGGYFYSIKNYYLKKKNEKAVHIGSNQLFTLNFKKASKYFFASCPKLLEKINTNELGRENLLEIVKYYNNCEQL